MKFIKQILENHKIKKQNKAYLKKNCIQNEIDNLWDFEKVTQNLHERIDLVYKFINKNEKNIDNLYKNISIQKGRITKQLNEQNKENKANNEAFSIIFNKLDKLEKKMLIKGGNF